MSGQSAGATEHQPESAVSVQNVHKTYYIGGPVHALDGVSLQLPRGSYTAVMGPSGSGKSTLMNLIGCLDTPTDGTVVINGHDVQTLSHRERTRLRGDEIDPIEAFRYE